MDSLPDITLLKVSLELGLQVWGTTVLFSEEVNAALKYLFHNLHEHAWKRIALAFVYTAHAFPTLSTNQGNVCPVVLDM